MRSIKRVSLSSHILRAELLSQGAALKSLNVQTADGEKHAVVWDLGSPAAYAANPSSAGVVAGRVAGRLAQGVLKIGAQRFELAKNEGNHTLHGGSAGFGWQNWRWGGAGRFVLSSPSGDQGFPARLEVSAAYSLPQEHVLRLELAAKARAITAVNMTHHPYWSIRGATVEVYGSQAQAVDSELIPTGAYDAFICDMGRPLDLCVKIDGHGFRPLAKITYPWGAMTVLSDASHAQIYNGKAGYVCIEPQEANMALDAFTLKPGKTWTRRIDYRFDL